MDQMEINFDEAIKLAGEGSQIRVIIENLGDVEFVKELFGRQDKIEEIDFGEARALVMSIGDPKDVKELAKGYANSIIICPHGNTSLRMAHALQDMGVKAYSLKGGLAGLRAR